MTNRWTHGEIVGVERTGLPDGEASASREACCMASAAYGPPTAKDRLHFSHSLPRSQSRKQEVMMFYCGNDLVYSLNYSSVVTREAWLGDCSGTHMTANNHL